VRYVVIIPARFKSTRLNGKPLKDINGIPMIVRTFNQCCKAVDRNLIYVSTDDSRIEKVCKENNIKVIMTKKKCLTGTDRVYLASKKINADVYINLQGDEPLFNPKDIKKIIKYSKKYQNEIITGFTKIKSYESFKSPHVPKVVFSEDKYLLYASRSPIPTNKSGKFKFGYRQVCIYAFPKKYLKKFYSTKKSKLEFEEDIEYLRFLEKGINLKCIELSDKSVAVDTNEGLQKVRKIVQRLEKNKSNINSF
jgi:3-deoxy-manno-octulosonate cytidylyltransferase (CMP-KDO synthetase)